MSKINKKKIQEDFKISRFHFRRYKKRQGNSKRKHPKLIVYENKNQFGYMGLTHSKSKGSKHKNIKLSYNPEFISNGERSKEPAYLRKKIEYDKKKNFGGREKSYILHPQDRAEIERYLRKHKKR